MILSHSAACVCTGTKRVKASAAPSDTGSDTTANAFGKYQQRSLITYADADGLETVEAWECSPDCPVRLLDEQSGESKSPPVGSTCHGLEGNKIYGEYSKSLRLENGYGDTGGASRFFYTAKADKAERRKSKHPTVKPLDLMRYLVRLVCPIGGVVLDPFMGSGTTIEAARAEHSKAIGFDLSAEYCRDAIDRLRQGAFTFD